MRSEFNFEFLFDDLRGPLAEAFGVDGGRGLSQSEWSKSQAGKECQSAEVQFRPLVVSVLSFGGGDMV